ncbi:MAG: GAF domain-containing protein [Anaerolineales bacterium]|nr:GAF domain-containing protein [Anaerolineales bacterium]
MPSKKKQPVKVKQLERIVEISRYLSSTHDLDQLLQAIVDVAIELTQSEGASILLFDTASGELRFEAGPDFQRNDLKTISVPLENSVAGWIFTHARPMVIQDAANDPRVYREVDQTLSSHTISLLGVPLKVKEKPIGVIEAINKQNKGQYTEDDLAVLETLAGQAAIAIENVRLLNKLQEANAELMRLDRMKSDFIAIASHELRTPLGLILGHATFLKETVTGSYHEQLDVIIRSAMRLKDIIEDMATIAHEEEGTSVVRKDEFSVRDLVINTTNEFMEAANTKGLNLEYDLPPNDNLTIVGDQEKIAVALTNLVQNAITFTDQGGKVGVKAELDEGYVKIMVVDTGIGVPENEQERIFERFYQVESHLTRKHGGMGLGLSIAKAMVEMHNGQIWCESKEGMGSIFCFMLPINEEKANAAAKVFKTS